MDQFTQIIIGHEGKEKSAYQDSLGFWTIGIGRLIDARKNAGLSDDEMVYLLNNDLEQCEIELSHFDFWTPLDRIRQDVIVELCFNIGLHGVLEFKQMIASLQSKDYAAAAMHLLNSTWAKQVKVGRADNMAARLKDGVYAN